MNMIKTIFRLTLFTVILLPFALSNLYAQWDDFVYPTVDFTDLDDGATQGAQIYHQIIPDPVTFIQECSLDVCKVLYNHSTEVPFFTTVTYYIESYDGISEKWGAPPHIYIRYSTQWIEHVYNNSGGDLNAVMYETKGVLYHELTHGYQYDDGNGMAIIGTIEGVADCVRTDLGYIPYSYRQPGGNWDDGYKTTGFFLDWLNQEKYPAMRFLPAFNATMDPAQGTNDWSWDEMVTVTGNTVQTEWNDYQAFLNSSFAASFTYDVYNMTVEFTDKTRITSGSLTNWTWDFGDDGSSSEQDPVYVYSVPGTYTVVLTVTDSSNNTDTKTHEVTVPQGSAYCDSRSQSSLEEWISQVTLGTFTNPSDARTYSDFTNLSINLARGQSHSFTLTPEFSGQAFDEYFKIWIDLNGDGDFRDADEDVFDAGTTTQTAINGQISIPASTELISTRMRVSMSAPDKGLVDFTDDGGTITAEYDDSPSGEEKEKAFDNTSQTKYLTFNASSWLQFQFPIGAQKVVEKYTITSANDAEQRDPRGWILQGSNDGSNWTTLDTRIGEDFPQRYQTREFTCIKSTGYEYYRLDMTNNSGTILQLAEVELLGAGDAAPQQDCETFDYGEVEDYTVTIVEGGPVATINVTIGCTPSSGTLPQTMQLWPQLCNDDWFTRTIAGAINLTLANGTSYPNWRAGYTNVGPGSCFSGPFTINLPNLGSLKGDNLFTLTGMDVTPSPYNQPPYSPSGDMDSDTCTFIGF
jgi:PKD repeat protein